MGKVEANTANSTQFLTPGRHTTYVYTTNDDPRYNWKRDAPAYPTWLPA